MENVSRRVRDIVKLGHSVNYESLNYDYPNSPSTIFLWILSKFTGVDDHAYVSGIRFSDEPFLSYRELELLIGWLNKMWSLCETDEDMQLLYDVIVKGKY